jgi:hypothetical protein
MQIEGLFEMFTMDLPPLDPPQSLPVANWASLRSRLRLFLDDQIPDVKDTLDDARCVALRFVLKPLYKAQAEALFKAFEAEIERAPQLYSRCWDYLMKNKEFQHPAVDGNGSESPIDRARWHLSQLGDSRMKLLNRPWYQVSTDRDWLEFAQSIRPCHAEWREKLEDCALMLAQIETAQVLADSDPAVGDDILSMLAAIRLAHREGRSQS